MEITILKANLKLIVINRENKLLELKAYEFIY